MRALPLLVITCTILLASLLTNRAQLLNGISIWFGLLAIMAMTYERKWFTYALWIVAILSVIFMVVSLGA
jgi:hypothetical protein